MQIICDNEAEVQLLKEKNRPMMIREALAEKFNLATPPNLAFIVRENYNKRVEKPPMPVYTQAREVAPTPPEMPPGPTQMGWDDYAQGVDGDAEVPF